MATAIRPAPPRLLVRAVEYAMVGLGLAYVVVSPGDWAELAYLLAWDVLALAYLLVGALAARRAAPAVPPNLRSALVFTLAASVVGMAAAASVILQRRDGTLAGATTSLAVAAMVLAWMLLHVGFAHLYAAHYHAQGGGMHFPDVERPEPVEFLYVSFTIAVSFAVSDVEVTERRMRWRVLVHGVVSFFYNAAVLALAIGLVTGT